jgi:hypothetical protein
MIVEKPIDVLNRLVVLHHRSLAAYLRDASPTWHRGDERAREVLEQIAADHERAVDRLGELIMEMDGSVQFGGFPMHFTAYHDLEFAFLRRRLIEQQQRDMAVIEECIARLDALPLAKAVAQEALGEAKAHLELLESLPAASGTGT